MGTRKEQLLPLKAIVLASVALACGGRFDSEREAPPVPPSGFWPSNAATKEIDPAVGEVIDVPAGDVRIGSWSYDWNTKQFTPHTCAGRPRPSAGYEDPLVRVRISKFRLMRMEVSFSLYRHCVETGRCADPNTELSSDPSGGGDWRDSKRARKPAGVSYFDARAFCQSFGGDLPTYAQWIRAAEGDLGAFGIKPLTELYVRCATGTEHSVDCDALRAAVLWGAGETHSRPLPDVGTNTWDVGPYGHNDLFAGAAEWVRLPTDDSRWPQDCADEAAPFDTAFVPPFEPTEGVRTMHIGQLLWTRNPLPAAPYPGAPPDLQYRLEGPVIAARRGQYFTGFRCAFPPFEP